MGKINEVAFDAHPVHEAARAGQYMLVEKLLMSGHSAGSLDELNRSPLYMACSHLHREEIVQTLIENLPRPFTTHAVKDPLIMSIAIGQLTYVEKLVRAGADINSLRQVQIFFPTDTKVTPVIYGLNEAKKFSIPGRVVSLEGVSLIEFAKQLGHTAIADYLTQHAIIEVADHSPRSSISLTSAESGSSFASFRSGSSASSTASSPYSLFRNFLGREAFYSLKERQKQLREPLLPIKVGFN